MSKPFDEQTFRMEIPPRYVCTGDEVDGIQEAIVDGNSYFFYLANSIAGAIIICVNGRFYTNESRMTVNLPSYTEEKTIPAEETTETQTIEGRGQGGTEQGGEYYGTIPEEDQGDNVETLTTYEADGTPRMFFKKNNEWIEIPLISAEEVERINGGLMLKQVNAEQLPDGSVVIS